MITHLSPKLIPDLCEFVYWMGDHFLECCRIGSHVVHGQASVDFILKYLHLYIHKLITDYIKREALENNQPLEFLPWSHRFWLPAMGDMRTYFLKIGWTPSKIQSQSIACKHTSMCILHKNYIKNLYNGISMERLDCLIMAKINLLCAYIIM